MAHNRSHRHRSRRSRPAAAAASITATALSALLVAGPASVASARPSGGDVSGTSTPAVAGHDPDLLFAEDFENGVTTTPVMLDKYIGEGGRTYTADPAWIDAAQCNGIITSKSSSNVAACSSNDQLKRLADVLGRITGVEATTNHVVSAWTLNKTLPEDAVQIQSEEPFELGSSGRYVSFGVSAAAGACENYAHPSLDFLLVDGTVEHPVSERPIDPCTDSRASKYTVDGVQFSAGEFVSNGGVLFAGDSLRWRLRNKQSSYSGNDGAIDRVTILDSTPTLENGFSGTPIVGDPARMTVRVVNTSEHGSKPGWSFAEQLPAGLHIAEEPGLKTTCTNADVDVAPGADGLSVHGDLAYQAADCAVSFDVTADAPGTYTIDGSAVTSHVGVDLPEAASVTFAPEVNALSVSDHPVITDGNGDDVADLGEHIAFRTTVRNDGNVLVRDLSVDGPLGVSSCVATELAPGASTECTSPSRAVAQADLDKGRITDEAAITGKSRAGQAVTASASSAVSTTAAAGAISAALETVVDGGGQPGVGEDIGLALEVRNDGNVSVHDITASVTDEPGITVSCPAGALAPSASIECDVEGGHTVTQADVDAGSVPFTVPVTAVDTTDTALTATATAEQDTEAAAPALSTTLEPSLAAGARPSAGDEVALVLHATNDGNVTLTGLAATVARPEGLTASCSDAPLAPGASTDCTVTGYHVTQDDIDAGKVGFGADATAQDPHGTEVSTHDDASVVLDQHAGITATVTAERDSQEAPHAGDPVRVAVTVHNGGNVTVKNVSGTVGKDHVTCPEGSLAPGADVSCTVEDHALTQTEIDRGRVAFEAEVSAKGAGGATAVGTDTTELTLARVPAVTAASAAVLDANEHEVPLAGDTASLSLTVSNAGNTTVDHLSGAVSGRAGLDVTCPSDALAPGKSATCEVSGYTLTQADVDAGAVDFDLTATARGTNGDRVETAAPRTTVSIVRAPGIASRVTAQLEDEAGRPQAGHTVSVHVAVRNTGNVSVHDLSGAVAGHDGLAVSCPVAVLAPGAEADCTTQPYALTQQDLDAGKASFAVDVAGVGADGKQVEAHGRAGVELAQTASLETTLVAHLAASEHEVPVAGDRIESTLSVVNTGNVTLTDPTAEVVELADVQVTCPTGPVLPGKSFICTMPEYALTQSDVDHGEVEVDVTTQATGPDGTTVTDREVVRVGLKASSGLDATAVALVAIAGGDERPVREGDVLHPGDTVRVRYTVANTGNLRVRDLQRAGDLPVVGCDTDALDPGQRTTCTVDQAHVVTDAEAAAGELVLDGQLKGQVLRGDGATVEPGGAASTGQHTAAPTSARTTTATTTDEARATSTRPVWVFSERIRTVVPVAAPPAPPVELAFTGTGVVAIAVPAAVVLLLAGLVLLLAVRRRREEARHQD